MNKIIAKILEEQENMNHGNRFYTVNRETGNFLHLLVKSKNPKNVLEVGTSIGYSTIWITSALNKGSKTITLDAWKERIEIAKSFFKRSGLNIKLVEGNALETIPKLKEKFDVVFLDATKSEYLKYLKMIKLNKNALIIADNTISHADKMKDFLEYAEKKNCATIKIGSGITLFVS